jgi:hypothetical protein
MSLTKNQKVVEIDEMPVEPHSSYMPSLTISKTPHPISKLPPIIRFKTNKSINSTSTRQSFRKFNKEENRKEFLNLGEKRWKGEIRIVKLKKLQTKESQDTYNKYLLVTTHLQCLL